MAGPTGPLQAIVGLYPALRRLEPRMERPVALAGVKDDARPPRERVARH